MATVRERICAAGANTLREFMCLDVGIVGGGITYTGEVIEVRQLQPLVLDEVTELIQIVELPTANIEQIDILSEIVEIKEDNIDGLC